MRNSRTLIVGFILVVLAGLAVWMLLKPGVVAEPSPASADQSSAEGSAEARLAQATAPRQTVGEPKSQTTATSVATTAQDVGGRLDLRTIRVCHDALLHKKSLEYRVNCDNIPAEQTSALSMCRSEQAQAAKEFNEAEAAAASCPPDLLMASAYYKAIKELALRGDIPAQRCLIQGYFASAAQEGEESRMRKDEVDEYLGLAKKFIDEAFERGDWSVVRWLARSRIGLQDFMLRSAYPFGFEHPETAYRMNYLLMLGKHQNFETSVDPSQFVETLKQRKALTPKQLQEAEDWAHNMFDQRFNGSQEGAATRQFCEQPRT